MVESFDDCLYAWDHIKHVYWFFYLLGTRVNSLSLFAFSFFQPHFCCFKFNVSFTQDTNTHFDTFDTMEEWEVWRVHCSFSFTLFIIIIICLCFHLSGYIEDLLVKTVEAVSSLKLIPADTTGTSNSVYYTENKSFNLLLLLKLILS